MTLQEKVTQQYGVSMKELLNKWYWEDGKSQKQIAQTLQCSTASVCIWFKKLAIPVHPPGTVQKNQGRKLTEKHKEIISKRHKGKKLSNQHKQLISLARKGQSPIGKSDRFQGKKHRGDGYIALYMPDHPHANSDGYYMEHRFVMEQKIGRILNPKEEVHHINHIRHDNRPENLHLFASKEDHQRHHMTERHAKRRNEKCPSIE